MQRFTTTLPLLFVAGATLSACSDGSLLTAWAARPASANASAQASNDNVAKRAFTSFDVPGASATLALDINAGGTIVGRYMIGSTTHGFLRNTMGEITPIAYPDAFFSFAAGINRRGDIVGTYILAEAPTVRHGYLLRNGEFTTIDPPGSNWTNPLGINDRGDIVGRFCDLAECGNRDFHGFLFHDGEFTTIDFPGAAQTNTWKSNNRGQIAGAYGNTDDIQQLFVLRRGEFTPITLPGALPIAQDNGGINSRGDIVGIYCDAAPPCSFQTGVSHGFLVSGDDFTTIDIPDAVTTQAAGINARREIVGSYFDASGKQHGFLLSGRKHHDDDDIE